VIFNRNKTFRGRGLLGRFLYVIPKSKIGLRTLEEPSISPEVVIKYRQAVKALLNLRQTKGKPPLYSLKLSNEAYQKWKDYAKVVEMLMSEEIGKLTHITDWAGKLAGAIARIAGLMHSMRYANDNPLIHEISFEDMSAAVKIGHCLTNHALTVFDLLYQDGALPIGRQFLNWFKQQKLTQFTHRDAQRKFRRLKKSELEPVLTLLKEHEILQEWEVKPHNGRPSRMFEVNPFIFETEDSKK
jgi:ACT domain-containing protein